MRLPFFGPRRAEVAATATDLLMRFGLRAHDEASHLAELSARLRSRGYRLFYELVAREIDESFWRRRKGDSAFINNGASWRTRRDTVELTPLRIASTLFWRAFVHLEPTPRSSGKHLPGDDEVVFRRGALVVGELALGEARLVGEAGLAGKQRATPPPMRRSPRIHGTMRAFSCPRG